MQLRVSVEPALLEEVRSLGQNGKSGKQQTYKVVGLTQVRLWLQGVVWLRIPTVERTDIDRRFRCSTAYERICVCMYVCMYVRMYVCR